MKQIRSIMLLWLMMIASSAKSQMLTAQAKITSPDLNLILQSMERIQQQNSARSRPYEVTRQYKTFRGDDTQPGAEVTAQISFIPPNRKAFKILQARGNARGRKVVRDLLEHETEPARKGHNRDIDRTNYDFVFLRQENFGLVPEYVLHIVPKRKENGLLLGQIWVDAKTFRIRRIEGVLAKSPSIWIKDIHITLQFAEVDGIWISVSLDAIATVHFFGRYTLTGVYAGARSPASALPRARSLKFRRR